MWWQKQSGKGLVPLGTTPVLRVEHCAELGAAQAWERLKTTQHQPPTQARWLCTVEETRDWEHPLFPCYSTWLQSQSCSLYPTGQQITTFWWSSPQPRRVQRSRGACLVQADRKLSNPESLTHLLLWPLFKSYQPLTLCKRGTGAEHHCSHVLRALAWHPSAARESNFQLGMCPGSPFHTK